MTSYVDAVGGTPVSYFAFTATSRSPNAATVVGIWKCGLVATASMVSLDRSGVTLTSAIWFVFLPVDPKWDRVRGLPRFRAVLQQCGFAAT
jgi:hypothetical protein